MSSNMNKNIFNVDSAKCNIINKDIDKQFNNLNKSLEKINSLLNKSIYKKVVKNEDSNKFLNASKKCTNVLSSNEKTKADFFINYNDDVKNYTIKLLDDRISVLEERISEIESR